MNRLSFLAGFTAFKDRPAVFRLIVLLLLGYHLTVLLYAVWQLS